MGLHAYDSDISHTELNATPKKHPFDGKIGVVMVTWNIGKSVLNSLKRVEEIADYCIVIDNQSTDETPELVQSFANEHLNVIDFMQHGKNNFAQAQNIGIRHCLQQGCDWVMLLDHDSLPDIHMFNAMHDVWNNLDDKNNVGMMIPNLKDRFSKREASYTRHIQKLLYIKSGFGRKDYLDDVLVAISSGALIPASLFRQIGTMNEAFHIDYVDYDFSLRVIQAGKRIIAVKNAILYHQLGFSEDHNVIGIRITTTNHNPTRRYTIYRNRIICWKHHGAALPAFVMCDVLAVIYDMFKIVCFERDRKQKLKSAWRGVKHALIDKESFEPRLAHH